MRLFTAFLQLVRLPNLLFIALTQGLFYYCIVLRIKTEEIGSHFSDLSFYLLIIASVLIAAAGYIINDYFDINIDQVNKPARQVVDKVIRRRWAMFWHIFFSAAGIAICVYIDLSSPGYWLAISNLACVVLLFGYSVSLKKKLLLGNILISALTAWVIIVIYLCYLNSFYTSGAEIDPNINVRFTRLALLYAGFAFIISIIREVIKDMEDREGDERYGCRTIPIVWGIPATKVFVGVWIVVLVSTLAILQFYVLQFGWWQSALYCFIMIIAPLLWVLRQLSKAQHAGDYHRMSIVIKGVMLTGILSMLFFKFY
ncbi:MAG: geranylgeranylglycerol-phosphate geranylgeranyltransferase [Chitinophagaceae bacterium]|nr:geranylgeranylglycerol-phosphate geranylgeranyltransferase [Chitinophagaceae bacterium]